MNVDWAELRRLAFGAASRAYSRYSGYSVGAAALVDTGRVVTGCNVECASYGVTLCAECGLVSAFYDSGGGRLIAMSCVDGTGRLLTPCGRCRQLLLEAGGPDLLVDGDERAYTLAELLPHPFDTSDDSS